jgi:hypothetical protein
MMYFQGDCYPEGSHKKGEEITSYISFSLVALAMASDLLFT